MDPQATAKLYCVQKNCFTFADFVPQGHDVAVVSTEFVLSIAMLWGGFI